MKRILAASVMLIGRSHTAYFILRRLEVIAAKCRRLFYVLRSARLDAWILRGRERSTGEPLCIAYMGTAPFKNHYAELAFEVGPKEEALGKCSQLLFWARILASHRDCDLIVYEMDEKHELMARFVRANFRNPVWMRVEMKITGDLETCMRKDRYKRIRRQVEKGGFSYEVRTDDEAFDEFYYKIYLPSVESRHGDAGIVCGYDYLQERFKHGELLFVKIGELRVGGSLVDMGHDKPRFMTMGLRDGSTEYMKMGVAGALYYYQFLRILELGGKTVNLGGSRGFLMDRPLMFKLSVGAYLASFHTEEAGFLYFKVRKLTPGLKAFLINNPFFVMDKEGKYWASIFLDSVNSVPEPVRELIKEYTQEFVSPRVYTFDPPEYLRENAAAIKESLGDCSVKSAYSALQ